MSEIVVGKGEYQISVRKAYQTTRFPGRWCSRSLCPSQGWEKWKNRSYKKN
nr:hypothetical protein [Candidatus Freyarchaeota archaeon]